MRVNEDALKHTGRTAAPDREGRLQYKSPKEHYRQRWFKLKGNLLFYYRTNEMGQQSEAEPSGVLLLEWCRVKLEPISDRPFVFSVEFEGDGGRPHYFSGQTQQQCEDWVTSITTASFDCLRASLVMLRTRIKQKTGKDPVEDLYRKLSGQMGCQVVGRLRCQPVEAPVLRHPTRRAPSPPHSNSTFYNNSAQEVVLGISTLQRDVRQARPWVTSQSQHDVTQSTRRTWVIPDSQTADLLLLSGPPRPATNGNKDVTKTSAVQSGWELFE